MKVRPSTDSQATDPQAPLILLVGFLGAGKTTVLRSLIEACREENLTPHVILNDYANANVDVAGLRDTLKDIIPIRGSCVCCSSKMELLEALAMQPSAPGEVVIVETNGTTDSASLLTLLAASPSVSHLQFPVQLSVLDGQRWQKRGQYNYLEEHQFRTASHFLVSRGDIVTPAQMRSVLATAATVNPHARQIERVDLRKFVRDLSLQNTADISPPVEPADPSTPHDHDSHHFASLNLQLPEQVDRTLFMQLLDGLPEQVVRAKGVVRFQDEPENKRMFQRVETEIEISPFTLKNADDVAPVLVLVGPGLDVGALTRQLSTLGHVPRRSLMSR